MVSEAGDVQTFLAQHPPFNHLTEDQLEYASDVAFSKSGNELELNSAAPDTPPTGMLIVRSGSLEVRHSESVLIDRLSSGDYLVTSVLYRDASKRPKVLVLEDCLYYELTASALQSLSASSKELAAAGEADKARAAASRYSDDEWSYRAEDERKGICLGQ